MAKSIAQILFNSTFKAGKGMGRGRERVLSHVSAFFKPPQPQLSSPTLRTGQEREEPLAAAPRNSLVPTDSTQPKFSKLPGLTD